MDTNHEFFRKTLKEFRAADANLSKLLDLHQSFASDNQVEATRSAAAAEQTARRIMQAIATKQSPLEDDSETAIALHIDHEITALKALSVSVKANQEELDRIKHEIGELHAEYQRALAEEESNRKKRNRRRTILAVTAVCVLVAFHFSLLSGTTLSFELSVDGKNFQTATQPRVVVDGKPFATGDKINLGRHLIEVTFPGGERFTKKAWAFYGKNDLGKLPLETSKGSLSVIVRPSPATVELKLGNRVINQGDAPLKLDKLPVNDYTLLIRRGEYEESRVIKIGRQQHTETNIDLNLGSVQLFADALDAEFELSGNKRYWKGKLPAKVDDVPGGYYSLTVKRSGWVQSNSILVSRNSITTNKTEFPYASLTLTSHPAGLIVSINDVDAGKTPIVLGELKPGQYKLTAKDGENDLSAEVTIGPREAAKYAFSFRYGTVDLTSTPAGATVLRKGKEVGKTPLVLTRIPAGKGFLTLVLPGYVSSNLTFNVTENTTEELNIKLIDVRYLEFMKLARTAFGSNRFTEAKGLIANVLELEPNDNVAIRLRDEVLEAEKQMEKVRVEAEERAKRAKDEARRAEFAAQLAQKRKVFEDSMSKIDENQFFDTHIRDFPYPFDVVWQAATNILEQNGRIVVNDPITGILRQKYLVQPKGVRSFISSGDYRLH